MYLAKKLCYTMHCVAFKMWTLYLDNVTLPALSFVTWPVTGSEMSYSSYKWVISHDY